MSDWRVAFDSLIKPVKKKNGAWAVECPIGLFGVESKDKVSAILEAEHYFQQYYQDGEYNHLFGR